MSVSRFGSSGKNQSFDNVDKKYVDQIFMTLSTNLAVKVDKSGDTLTGDLYLSCENDDERYLGIKDIAEGQSVSYLLGDWANQILYNYGHPITFAAIHGYKFTSSCGDVCKLGGSDSTNSHFYNDVIMNDKCISDLHNPKLPQDAATKNYVDTRYVKNNVGYVPDLVSNINNKSGFKVSASHDPENVAYHVFNSWQTDEWVAGTKSNFWIQIQCPESIRIHKFALRGKSNNTDRINNWKFQASNDGINWNDLYHSHSEYISNITSFFDVKNSKLYDYFRILVLEAENNMAGLNYWQLYTLDPIV